MVEGLEVVSHIVVQVTQVEMSILGWGGFKSVLSQTIVDLYVKILRFLATARRFFDQSAGGKLLFFDI